MIAFIAVAACLPETCHQGTRGIDKLGGTASSRKFVWINPFASLGLLRSPNLLAMVRPRNCIPYRGDSTPLLGTELLRNDDYNHGLRYV